MDCGYDRRSREWQLLSCLCNDLVTLQVVCVPCTQEGVSLFGASPSVCMHRGSAGEVIHSYSLVGSSLRLVEFTLPLEDYK